MKRSTDPISRALEALADVCGQVQGPVGQVTVADSGAMTYHDPSDWREDFFRWALERCAYRDRCFGGVSALCTDFADWALAHGSVPCAMRTLERLLDEAGLLVADGLVYGLVLRGDLEAAVENSRCRQQRWPQTLIPKGNE